MADVEPELARDFAGQAFDFDFASNGLKNAALLLDPGGLTEGVHGYLDTHADVHGDAEKVHVKQAAGDGINLPVLHNGRLLLAGDRNLEQRVVSGGGAENLAYLLGVHAES